MQTGFRWRRVAGVALLLAAALAVIGVFSQLCVTDEADIDLMDKRTARFGWRYELRVNGAAREYEPKFSGDILLELPEGTDAVRVTRTMTEEISQAELQLSPSVFGVEVALDGELLYTDFHGAVRGADGFLSDVEEEVEQIRARHEAGAGPRKVRMSLPRDYRGRELSMTTYFPEGWESPQPEFPTLGSAVSPLAQVAVNSVLPLATMTIYALLALLAAGVFLLDGWNGKADGRAILLCLYFLLRFLERAYTSEAGGYSLLEERIGLSYLRGLYVAPLCLYLSLRLTKRWKIPLCACTVVWAVYEGARMFMNVRRGAFVLEGRSGLGVFVLLIAVSAALIVEALLHRRDEGWGRRALICGLAVAAVTFGYVYDMGMVWGGISGYLCEGVWGSLRTGYFMPTVNLLANIASGVAMIAMIVDFTRRTLHTRQEMSALEERGRRTMESYERMLDAQQATAALRHEMRHHLTALSGILSSGDAGRAKRYVDAIAGDLERLPAGRYSPNLVVDVIAGNYLDRARAQWIRVEHRLNVPPELPIADEDLSVFLSNMLQNAVEACERMGPDAARFIRVEMRLRGNFLFVKCVNSAPDEPESAGRSSRPGHGYGLAAMRKVAEKYDSVLLMERGPGEFTVRSDLCLKRAGAAPEPAQ